MNCTSCGSPIPDGQGKSCSMCYGDINHGSDGYYEAWAEEQRAKAEQEQAAQQAWEQEQEMNQRHGEQEQAEGNIP